MCWQIHPYSYWFVQNGLVLAVVHKTEQPPALWDKSTRRFHTVLDGWEHKSVEELKLLMEALVALEHGE